MNCECTSRASIIFGVLLTLVATLFFYINSSPDGDINVNRPVSQRNEATTNKHNMAYEYKKRRTISIVLAVSGMAFTGFGIAKKRSSDCIKKCPACNKFVKPESKICRHCANKFTDA